MSEYIIEWFDIGGQLANLLNGNIPLVLWPKKIREERLREKIVRCRDCKYVTADQSDHDFREPLWCSFHRMDVRTGGFCAWGERR